MQNYVWQNAIKMSRKKLVGIHQPNFLPWIGYFNKIYRSDVFILLDDVQYPKSGGSSVWTNRNLILKNGNSSWATIPIFRGFSGLKNINEIRFAKNINWKQSYLDLIRSCYAKSRYFSYTYEFLKDSLNYDTEFLCELNIHLIKSVLRELGISKKSLFTSSSLIKNGKSNDLLCSLIKSVNGDSYICGAGSFGYLDPKIFQDHNIELIYQNYTELKYQQLDHKDFKSGLSIVDALMNCGVKKTKQLVIGELNVKI